MDIRSVRSIRRQVVRDIHIAMRTLGLVFVSGNMTDAVNYICMINDLEFDGSYEYTGFDWVCDTKLNYPEWFGLNY